MKPLRDKLYELIEKQHEQLMLLHGNRCACGRKMHNGKFDYLPFNHSNNCQFLAMMVLYDEVMNGGDEAKKQHKDALDGKSNCE